jgi:hypothetical protein
VTGVDDIAPAAATEPDDVQRTIREDRRRKRLEEHRRAASLNAAAKDPDPGPRVLEKVRHANREWETAAALRKRGERQNRRQIQAHEAAARRAEGEAARLRQEELDAHWLRRVVEETVALAKARGGEVERTKTHLRVTSHDGLRSLLDVKDGLTPEQYEAGLAFREGWEARSQDLASQMGAESAGSGHDNDRYVMARLNRAKKLQRLGAMVRAVAVECAEEPAALRILSAVAGDGAALSEFGEGRAFGRNLAVLKWALEVVIEIGGSGNSRSSARLGSSSIGSSSVRAKWSRDC